MSSQPVREGYVTGLARAGNVLCCALLLLSSVYGAAKCFAAGDARLAAALPGIEADIAKAARMSQLRFARSMAGRSGSCTPLSPSTRPAP